ncbi:MAG: ABC transporter permease, partial [Bacteroidia bacterium]
INKLSNQTEMLFQIAWRNLFRNRLRSFVIMGAITLGITLGIFMLAFSWGLMDQRGRDIIDTQIAHVQVHQSGFSLEDSAELVIQNASKVLATLEQQESVLAVSARTLRTGMVASTRKSLGVLIRGIDPQAEAAVTTIAQKMVQGDFFTKKGRNSIIIGENLAEELGVKLRSKITLTFYRNDGEITAGAFRVAGTFKTAASPFDKGNVFVKQSDLQRLMGDEAVVHEIALRLTESELAEPTKKKIQASLPSYDTKYWGDVQPTLKLMNEQFNLSVAIFMGIIIFALLFGILNTMLMAVLERKKELGMLMAVGMKRYQIFGMIMIETIMLSMIGAAIGLLIGYGVVSWFGVQGINLGMMKEGLSSMGMADMVYTKLEFPYYVQTTVMMVLAAIIAAIPPSIKALKLNPVEAIH